MRTAALQHNSERLSSHSSLHHLTTNNRRHYAFNRNTCDLDTFDLDTFNRYTHLQRISKIMATMKSLPIELQEKILVLAIKMSIGLPRTPPGHRYYAAIQASPALLLKLVISDIIEGFNLVFKKSFLLDAYCRSTTLTAMLIDTSAYPLETCPTYSIDAGLFEQQRDLQEHVRSLQIFTEGVVLNSQFSAYIDEIKSIVRSCPELLHLSIATRRLISKSRDLVPRTVARLTLFVDKINKKREKKICLEFTDEWFMVPNELAVVWWKLQR